MRSFGRIFLRYWALKLMGGESEAVRPEARSVLHWHLGGHVSDGFTIQESLLCSIGLSGVFAAS